MTNLIDLQDTLSVFYNVGGILVVLSAIFITLTIVFLFLKEWFKSSMFVVIALFLFALSYNIAKCVVNLINTTEGMNKISLSHCHKDINDWVEENTTEPYIIMNKRKGEKIKYTLYSSKKFMIDREFKSVE